MKPKAMVIIARYGPFTRSAGSASRRAHDARQQRRHAATPAQKLQPALVVRIATA